MADELGQILGNVSLNSAKGYTKVGLRAALLKWRGEAVVAELKAARDDLSNFTARHDQEFVGKAKDFLEDRIKQLQKEVV